MASLSRSEFISPTDDPRKVENWALSVVAEEMLAAKDSGDEETILSSVRLNWRLWTIFQAALLDPACPWPQEERNNLLSLAAFVDRESGGIIAFPEPDKLNSLISLNRSLAAGLAESLASH